MEKFMVPANLNLDQKLKNDLPDFIPTKIIAGYPLVDFKSMTPDLWRSALSWVIEEVNARVSFAEKIDVSNLSASEKIELFENISNPLYQIYHPFYHQANVGTNEQIDEVNTWFTTELSSMTSRIYQSDILASWWLSEQNSEKLTDVEKIFVDKMCLVFKSSGSGLPPETKSKIAETLAAIAEAENEFTMANLSNNENTIKVKRSDLSGFRKEILDSLAVSSRFLNADKSEQLDHPDDILLLPVGSAFADSAMAQLENRTVRMNMWKAWSSRGNGVIDGDKPTSEIIARIVELRHKLANLLGYKCFADMKLAGTMAETVDNVMNLVKPATKMASVKAESELASIHCLAMKNGLNGPLEPWDVEYWRAKHIENDLSVPMDEVSAYFPLSSVRKASFDTAKKLFNLDIYESPEGIENLPPDSKLFIIKENGIQLGAMITDDFSKNGKSAGAWMMNLRTASSETDQSGLVVNCLNLPKPKDGTEPLLSFDDAVTLFHEFGHALHGLMGRHKIIGLSGTEVAKDFVEFPSQIMENWIKTKEGIMAAGRHHKTGEAIPEELAEKIVISSNFGGCIDKLAAQKSAWIDMELHSSDPPKDPAAFERHTLASMGVNNLIKPRHSLGHFAHIFGWDYSAGYYSYVWAEALEADAFSRFTENPFDQEAANSLKKIFSSGGTIKPSELFEEFMGRSLNPDALGERWLAKPKSNTKQLKVR